MRKLIGWTIVVLGVLLAAYPIGWGFQVLGANMQGEAAPAFDLSATIWSLVLGGGLILGGWKLSHPEPRDGA